MYKDILLAIDLGEASSWKKALPTAVEYCKAFGSTLHLSTIVPDFGMAIVGSFFPEDFEEKALEKAKTELHAFAKKHVPDGVSVQHVVGQGTVYEEILRIAEDINCDLIVMASHRPELQDYLLGPNAARVVRHANTSVLVVRG
ncbi:MAG: universal stress protein [Alphaproteobacteria bacterium]|nr:universal stress protein [Alphaproteobacteria bacterium]